MKKLLLLVALSAGLMASFGGGFFDNWGVEPASAVATDISPVIDPGGGGDSQCTWSLLGVQAYFVDWQSRMVGWFYCASVGPFVWPPLVYKAGYGNTHPQCTLGERRVYDHSVTYWLPDVNAYC